MHHIKDHPLRYRLANELHARPFPSLEIPCTAAFLAVKRQYNAVARDRADDVNHLVDLLDRYGAPHPQPGATHYSGQIGRHFLKWEQHAEFVTYSVFTPGLSARPFDPAEFEIFPEDWLSNAPGVCVTSALIRVEPRPDHEKLLHNLKEWFVPESLAVSQVLDDAAVVATDFRINAAGHICISAMVSLGTDKRRIGRIVQRLCEIETYKSMSMIGFARVGHLSDKMGRIEERLNHMMAQISKGDVPADSILDELLQTSAELESLIAESSFRFGATGAYETIVNQRIDVMRESRFEGRQTFAEFMMRRYDPAMRTVASTKLRLEALAERAMRAGELLRTKVDVSRSAQNQALLESMDRRADLALRLQKTVEGLSVVAISYYAVSLTSYLAYPLSVPLSMNKEILTAIVTPPVVLAVWWMVSRIRARVR
ncbi:DUF3422 family protein [Pseudopelagicola sp. nBUS_20]|uniref:DUF3422 family protein n=1 Tax=Pseudopelagicola sp. nBUS_20 TaxID=3395317 RepID=UPI003EC035CD